MSIRLKLTYFSTSPLMGWGLVCLAGDQSFRDRNIGKGEMILSRSNMREGPSSSVGDHIFNSSVHMER